MTLTVALLLLRSLVRGKRAFGLAAVTAAPVVLAVIGTALGINDPNGFVAVILESLFLPTVAAFVTLILAAGALGDEREEGTILYLVATPLSRRALVLGALLAAFVGAEALLVPGAVAVVLAAGTVTLGGLVHVLLGTSLMVAAYASAFVWLSLITRRPVLAGVLYILIWETTIAPVATSAGRLSIAAYGKTIVADALPGVERFGVPSFAPGSSAIVLLMVIVVAIVAATRALSRTELP